MLIVSVIFNVVLHILCVLYLIICFIVINITVEESMALKKPFKKWFLKSNPVHNLFFSLSVYPKDELQRLLDLLKKQDPLPEEQLQKLCIEMNDFIVALSSVQPSAKREGFVTIPDVTWADIGALEDVREELTMAILVCLNLTFKDFLHFLLCRK